MSKDTNIEEAFYTEISDLLKKARDKSCQAVNTMMVQTYLSDFP